MTDTTLAECGIHPLASCVRARRVASNQVRAIPRLALAALHRIEACQRLAKGAPGSPQCGPPLQLLVSSLRGISGGAQGGAAEALSTRISATSGLRSSF